jgi:hypothetical protein
MRSKIQVINEMDDEFIFEDESPMRREEKMKHNHAQIEPQFMYLGNLTNKRHFRAFVYGEGAPKLAKNYEEFEKYVSSGLWFQSVEEFMSSKEIKKPEKSEKPKISYKTQKKTKLEEVAKDEEIAKEEDNEDSSETAEDGVIEYGADR